MRLDDLVHSLDELLAVPESGPDPGFASRLPRVYQAIGYDYTRTFEPAFCRLCNGLMLRAADTVDEVYGAAFPCPEVLAQALARRSALLFLHHPIDMEVAGEGFLPIPPEALARLQARGVSLYACHAPLDCHDRVGTSAAMVEALGARVERSFAPYGPGDAGRIAAIDPTSPGGLIQRARQIFGVSRVEVGGGRPEVITRLAIVAGGGDDVELMREAEGLGAQAYLTGEWYTRTRPADAAGQAWAEGNLAACRAYAAGTPMALIGVSHAASEHLVMRTQFAAFIRGLGLPFTALAQSDWWR